MNFLQRILTRTPSLRARVVVATVIGAAIPVLIVGVVVWFGITNDRKERLDRRLDEAAGFAIPFLPRGLGEIPKSPSMLRQTAWMWLALFWVLLNSIRKVGPWTL